MHRRHVFVGSVVLFAIQLVVGLSYAQQAARTISGSVTLASGKPAGGAHVGLASDKTARIIVAGEMLPERSEPAVIAAPDGSFRVPVSAYHREVQIVAVHPEGTAIISEQDLRQRGKFQLKPWTTVTGIVREANRVLANEPVRFFNPAAARVHRVVYSGRTTTGLDGRFRLEKVPTGIFEVGRDFFATRPIGVGSSLKPVVLVTTKPGEVTDIEIGGSGRPVIGKVVVPAALKEALKRNDPGISPSIPKWDYPDNYYSMTTAQRSAWSQRRQVAPDWLEYLKTAHVRSHRVDVADDGTFRVEDVAPGNYLFSVYVPERPADGDKSRGGVMAKFPFTVPPIEGLRMDEPLEIGTIQTRRIP